MCSVAMHRKKLIELVTRHLERYPAMELPDVYKLLYQSVMGPAHILHNKELAYSYLKKEFKSLDENYETELYVDVSLEHEIVRLNIPVYQNHGTAETLFEMLHETAKQITPDKKKLIYYWAELGLLIENKNFENFTPNEWKKLNKTLSENDFLPLSHSDTYKELYKPSYRIVLKGLINIT